MSNITNNSLFEQIKNLIEQTKNNVAISVNSSLTMMYWEIGNRINQNILKNQRAEYGKEIVVTLSRQLQDNFGKGFDEKNLRRMMQFANAIEKQKVVTLSRQLSWSHFLALLPLQDNLKIEFYAQMTIAQNWGVRTLRERIDSMLYERTALSKQPDELIKYELNNIKQEEFSKNMILKDSYFLDFLDINDRYLEKDLEDAILRSIEKFIFELGVGFSFIERQKRIIIDGEDFKIDLLFYNRKLKRLVAIDLKIGRFKAEYKGQMELYLKWLSKYEKEEGENEPLGIILCADKKEEQIELLELEKSGIHVAQYLTVLPPKEILEAKLHQAIESAKAKYFIDNKEKID
ncbi:MAG: PDDEXK nuclease domain-containing protein [Aliarcobacter skirrowii]|uniref:PDDEXK nuclease domain-containing protein n=1 Tax=Aliarcobacter skirrowii TaxID=28200 RepID=UPI00242C22D4|nr:PDDEXK nuclease domain-containing protein [Aliarcobacter skirrowii]MDD2508976.1 PDDEXK nuclease domain-containing protein [Aliarcobacter skirrowii]MDD3497538.1 PDDEXK nuclease domain-containing protein [Aliarcobacter skirrowii]